MLNARKSTKTLIYAVSSLALILITVYAAVQLTGWQTRKATSSGKCNSLQHVDHQVIIQYGKVSPSQTDAKRCDQLTILNLDDKSRLIAFGQHDKHIRYGGMEQRLLTNGQRFTVTLDKPGQFRFHDHFDDQAQGTFTVTR